MSIADVAPGKPEVWEWYAERVMEEARAKADMILDEASDSAGYYLAIAREQRDGGTPMALESLCERYFSEILPEYREHMELMAECAEEPEDED